MKSKRPVLKIIVIVWIIFSVLYVGYTQYNYFVNFVAKRSYDKGLSDAVVKVISQAQECKSFPVTIGQSGVQLINAACVKDSTGTSTSTSGSSSTSTTK